jgi:metal-dependent amidase/aminoacylase/carboxypeptidase family protein
MIADAAAVLVGESNVDRHKPPSMGSEDFSFMMEKVPGLDFIPAYFIGAGVFFALMTHGGKPEGMGTAGWYGTAALAELVACAIGLGFGWVTVTARGWYTAKVSPAATK